MKELIHPSRDFLTELLVRNTCTYIDIKELPRIIECAEINRVKLYFLIKALKLCKDAIRDAIRKHVNELRKEYIEWVSEVKRILKMLKERKIKFIVIKHAPYPHLSYDIDIVFPEIEDFEKAEDIITSSMILRVDPHVSSLREYKAATLVVPSKFMWENRVKTYIYGEGVYTISNELSTIVYALHPLKHREIYLGDLISYSYYFQKSDRKKLLKLINKINCSLKKTFTLLSYNPVFIVY